MSTGRNSLTPRDEPMR